MNSIIIDGNLVRDIELRKVGQDKSVAKFSIANNEGFGEYRKTSYFEVEVWGKTAEACANFLKKGSKVAVKGVMQQENWTDKDGAARKGFKIVDAKVEFKDSKPQEGVQETTVLAKEDNPFADDNIPF